MCLTMRSFARLSMAIVFIPFVLAVGPRSQLLRAEWGTNTAVVSLQGGTAGGVFRMERQDCSYAYNNVRCRVMRITNTQYGDTDFDAWQSGVIVALGFSDVYLHVCAFDTVQVNSYQVRCVNPAA